MVDLHTHVLPGLDDGPPSLEVSLAMLRIAAEAGTTDLVATPHANLEFDYDPVRVEEKLAELREASGGTPRLHRGCDFHLYFDNIQAALADPSRYTIAGGRYLLVEFPDLLIAKTTDEVFDRMLSAGIVPVITHPERNFLLQTRVEHLERWVEAGCLLQVTALSFLGRFGGAARSFCRELMRRNLVHVVASDAHDDQDRTPRLDEAFRHVAKKWGEARAERLFVSNPRAILTGQALPEVPQEELVQESRAWYRFW